MTTTGIGVGDDDALVLWNPETNRLVSPRLMNFSRFLRCDFSEIEDGDVNDEDGATKKVMCGAGGKRQKTQFEKIAVGTQVALSPRRAPEGWGIDDEDE
jgi:hypothetical protein